MFYLNSDCSWKHWYLNCKQYSSHLLCNHMDKVFIAMAWALSTGSEYKVNGAFHNAIESSLKYCLQLCSRAFSDGAANTCGMEILCQADENKNVINILVTRAGGTLNNFNSCACNQAYTYIRNYPTPLQIRLFPELVMEWVLLCSVWQSV